MEIQRLFSSDINQVLSELVILLQDSVRGGASIGFLLPITEEGAREYWREVESSLKGPFRILLVAKIDANIVGSVQLDLASRPNGSHRAEIIKLMVHSSRRNRGIGQALLNAIEEEARKARRTTLVLDTREGDPSEQLYLKMGYLRAGTIPEYARSTTVHCIQRFLCISCLLLIELYFTTQPHSGGVYNRRNFIPFHHTRTLR